MTRNGTPGMPLAGKAFSSDDRPLQKFAPAACAMSEHSRYAQRIRRRYATQ